MSHPPHRSCIDHLVVTAPSLSAGMDWVGQRLGLSMLPRLGGEHVRLGTHNALLSLGPQAYLEVIAIDPAAPAPQRPRWFGLDELGADAPPRLAHWVARCEDIGAAAAASPIAPGQIEAMQRGALEWLITIAADGRLACDGLMPSLIQWQTLPHPAASLPPRGALLQRLELRHPRAQALQGALEAIGMDGTLLRVEAAPTAGLRARIMTAQGERVLE